MTKNFPHTARCEVGFALGVLGDCEVMTGDLEEYNMNYGDNPNHVLRDKMGRRMTLVKKEPMTAMTTTLSMELTSEKERMWKVRKEMS